MIVGSAHPFCRRFDFSLFVLSSSFLRLDWDYSGNIRESLVILAYLCINVFFFFGEMGKYVDILVKNERESLSSFCWLYMCVVKWNSLRKYENSLPCHTTAFLVMVAVVLNCWI